MTSQRAQIVDIDHRARSLTLHTDDGRRMVLAGEAIDAEHLDHGYALTVHRQQGATSDRAHVLAEGGGRQLAYVALSRARHRATVHTIADSQEQAVEKITDDWNTDRDQPWITPPPRLAKTPAPNPPPPPRPMARPNTLPSPACDNTSTASNNALPSARNRSRPR